MLAHGEVETKGNEVKKVLEEADERWRQLELRVDEAEAKFIVERMASLKKWFSLDEQDLTTDNWTSGGLRHTIRGRVQRLVMAPLTDKMEQRAGLTSTFIPEERLGTASGLRPQSPQSPQLHTPTSTTPSGASATSRRPLERLSKHFKTKVLPLLKTAKKADAELTKLIKKTSKEEREKGIMPRGVEQDTEKVKKLKKTRPGIWEQAKTALEAVLTPVQRLMVFFEEDCGEPVVNALMNAVPAVVARAICDWYFQKSVLELQELQDWWEKTKAGLQQKDDGKFWEMLQEQEGLILRRSEAAIEGVVTRRTRYSIYANFGGTEAEVLRATANSTDGWSPKLEESVTLLATVVSEMHQRLAAIRDGAFWRVIDTAKSIHQEQRVALEVPPWQAVSAQEGVEALFKRVLAGETPFEEAVALDGDALVDASVLVMGRLQRVMYLASDLQEFFQQLRQKKPLDGLTKPLNELSALLGDFTEDLMVLMDEPTQTSLQSWRQQWARVELSSASQALEQAIADLALPLDSSLEAPAFIERRKWLCWARGLVVLLADASARQRLAAPLLPPGAATDAPRRLSAPQLEDPGIDVLHLETPSGLRQVPLDAPGSGLRPGASGERPGTSGGRPETPSTAADDDAGMRGSKLSDGQLLRPGSATVRLPPVQRPHQAW